MASTSYVSLKFQSSPSPKAGSYLDNIAKSILDGMFQSSPSPKAGSYLNVPVLV